MQGYWTGHVTNFHQIGPELKNSYQSDPFLKSYLRAVLGEGGVNEVHRDLDRLGGRATGELRDLAATAESQAPQHIPFDPWGNRVDRIVMSDAWNKIEQIGVEERLITSAYDRTFGDKSRILQIAKLYLFHPSSAFVSCPLAMTDGAIRLIEIYGDDYLRNEILPHLLTKNPNEFWTVGQWMTEKTGGSDVGASQTIAKKKGDKYLLYGDKWFTSAISAQVAMTLARVEGEESKGLSLFCLPVFMKDGKLNNILVHRLKDKLGTRALPTGEISLYGSEAHCVGGVGHGIKKISTLFNITRIYNSVCAISTARRALDLAKDYSTKRSAFGKLIHQQPLHKEILLALEADLAFSFFLVFSLAELQGKDENETATSEDKSILRALTPLVKLYTGKQSVQIVSECLEAIGGAGYVEDTGLPGLYRDAQVFPIWEGTTNILCLDFLRGIEKEKTWEPLCARISENLSEIHRADLMSAKQEIQGFWLQTKNSFEAGLQDGIETFVPSLRRHVFKIIRAYGLSVLLKQMQNGVISDPDILKRNLIF